MKAFTLIEVLVAIVIILILLGLGFGVWTSSQRNAEVTMTRTAVYNLHVLCIDMEARGVSPVDSCKTTAGVIAKAKGSRAWKEFLSAFPDNLFNGTTVKDAWGKEIFFSYPSGSGYESPPGATLPPRGDRQWYFRSAGPDGKWATDDDVQL